VSKVEKKKLLYLGQGCSVCAAAGTGLFTFFFSPTSLFIYIQTLQPEDITTQLQSNFSHTFSHNKVCNSYKQHITSTRLLFFLPLFTQFGNLVVLVRVSVSFASPIGPQRMGHLSAVPALLSDLHSGLPAESCPS
jgi:hypothetical protein